MGTAATAIVGLPENANDLPRTRGWAFRCAEAARLTAASCRAAQEGPGDLGLGSGSGVTQADHALRNK